MSITRFSTLMGAIILIPMIAGAYVVCSRDTQPSPDEIEGQLAAGMLDEFLSAVREERFDAAQAMVDPELRADADRLETALRASDPLKRSQGFGVESYTRTGDASQLYGSLFTDTEAVLCVVQLDVVDDGFLITDIKLAHESILRPTP